MKFARGVRVIELRTVSSEVTGAAAKTFCWSAGLDLHVIARRQTEKKIRHLSPNAEAGHAHQIGLLVSGWPKDVGSFSHHLEPCMAASAGPRNAAGDRFGDIGTQPSQLSHSPERAPHCSHGILFVGWVVGDGPVKPSGLQNSRCCVPQYHNEDADEMRCRDEHGQGSNTNSKLP